LASALVEWSPPVYLIGAVNRYKAGLSWPDYVKEYQRNVLDKLDPAKVLSDLGDEAILLCWEKTREECHRRLVAEWLEKNLDIKIPEL
jgi:DNA-directed RNA polymerase subunit N (RpoN/RPB10)